MDACVLKIMDTIDKSSVDELSLPSLCRIVNLSPSRLRYLFKRETGHSPIQYVKAHRMKCAERLLRTTFLSVKQVAFLSGGKDVSYFVREFKKQYGVSPSDFRERTEPSSDRSNESDNGGE
jgi:AraC-like DNA-binding protein